MARAKDDPILNRLFEGPAGGEAADGEPEALRRDVLGILEGAGDGASAEPLDDGLIAAYLDGALEAPERTALEARLAASHVLREQVAAAASAREAGLKSGLALPPAFADDYDAVPGPAKASPSAHKARSAGLIGRLFGAPTPARRWLAASLPVLAAVVVVAVIGPQLLRERDKLASGEGAGPAASAPAADATTNAKAKLERAEPREAERAKKAAPSKPAEIAKPKPDRESMTARRERRAGRAGTSGGKVAEKKAAKDLAVVNTAIVPLSSELRDAVVFLGRRQQISNAPAPLRKEQAKQSRKRFYEEARPSIGSSTGKTAGEARRDKPAGGIVAQRAAGVTSHHIAVINRAVAPDCTNNPASCCGSHRVDQNLLNRLLASRPPLQSLKVVHLSSRACYLTLP
jgi:hypothetical protein